MLLDQEGNHCCGFRGFRSHSPPWEMICPYKKVTRGKSTVRLFASAKLTMTFNPACKVLGEELVSHVMA